MMMRLWAPGPGPGRSRRASRDVSSGDDATAAHVQRRGPGLQRDVIMTGTLKWRGPRLGLRIGENAPTRPRSRATPMHELWPEIKIEQRYCADLLAFGAAAAPSDSTTAKDVRVRLRCSRWNAVVSRFR